MIKLFCRTNKQALLINDVVKQPYIIDNVVIAESIPDEAYGVVSAHSLYMQKPNGEEMELWEGVYAK